MGKKDFTESIDSTSSVYDAIATATAQEEHKERKARKTYTAQEAQEALENLHTSGMKGVKLPRINLAFTPSNYDYIKFMAAARGENLTEFVNSIIAQHAEQNADTYKQVLEFRKNIKKDEVF